MNCENLAHNKEYTISLSAVKCGRNCFILIYYRLKTCFACKTFFFKSFPVCFDKLSSETNREN